MSKEILLFLADMKQKGF